MSNRQNRSGRPIRGPHSALTDYLASQNISAAQIRSDHEARRQAAAAAAAAATTEGVSNTITPDEGSPEDDSNGPVELASVVAGRNRSRANAQKQKKQAAAIEKIKKSKEFKKRKQLADDDLDDDDLADIMANEKTVPAPGQSENCELCGKRFTVTPYSRAGPNGGLLCNKCGQDLAKDEAASSKKKRKSGGLGAARRKVQSRALDGLSPVGVKSLMALCVETLAKNIDLADNFGDLPASLVDKLARTLSKRRLLDSKTLDLFLQPHVDEVTVYDGARLTSEDYKRIFQRTTKLRTLKLRNAIQFKNGVMEYLTTRNISLDSIALHGASLVTEECWRAYLVAKGAHLKAIKVYFTDKHFGDDLVASLNELCPSLERLKIVHNQKLTDQGVEHIATMKGLRHLSLDLRQPTKTEPYVKVINSIGNTLETLSLTDVVDLDDRVLDAIHDNCRSLSKLRITKSEMMTDPGFVRLFKDWKNKPLDFIDFQCCRFMMSELDRENHHLYGLCSDGFRALMEHSGKFLRKLNICGCRDISREAFEEVFSIDKEYPALSHLELSFCGQVTDFVIGSIFRSCPNIRDIVVYGCMKVREVRVPRGKLLIGVPNAIGMIIEGTDD
ncbi:hypothetical protein BX600DRAFT_289666 [Xylariales sp. PMI_506]|nr:hypothetical protein BX600DRAFT_289666 [Xylariales sp. PMI_506]